MNRTYKKDKKEGNEPGDNLLECISNRALSTMKNEKIKIELHPALVVCGSTLSKCPTIGGIITLCQKVNKSGEFADALPRSWFTAYILVRK
jgi:hypothetical protein